MLKLYDDFRVVGETGEGAETVRRAKELQPHVVLLDLAMPVLDGFAILPLLREACPHTRVLVVSAYSGAERVHRALAAGAAGYVLKLNSGEELATAIRTVHRGERYLSPSIAETLVDAYLQDPSHPSRRSSLHGLSEREAEVLQLIGEGKNTAAIADQLCLSIHTVNTYRRRIMQKLDVHGMSSLLHFAVETALRQQTWDK